MLLGKNLFKIPPVVTRNVESPGTFTATEKAATKSCAARSGDPRHKQRILKEGGLIQPPKSRCLDYHTGTEDLLYAAQTLAIRL